MKNTSRNWSKEEVRIALALYCQLPFGQMHARNPLIIELAKLLHRTPSSLALKLVNLASLDPTLQARGIKGMANASKVDREVWGDYYGNWAAIAATLPQDVVDKLEYAATEDHRPARKAPEGPTEVMRTQPTRRGQQFFRIAVLSAYDNKCCISGITIKSLLRASHLIPWSTSEEHRLNPMNGVCLNALHDAAFDQGLLTIDEECCVVLSSKLNKAMPTTTLDQMFIKYNGKRIATPEKFLPQKHFIEYHRKHIFKP